MLKLRHQKQNEKRYLQMLYEIICNVLKENHVSKGLILTGTLKSGQENVLIQENL